MRWTDDVTDFLHNIYTNKSCGLNSGISFLPADQACDKYVFVFVIVFKYTCFRVFVFVIVFDILNCGVFVFVFDLCIWCIWPNTFQIHTFFLLPQFTMLQNETVLFIYDNAILLTNHYKQRQEYLLQGIPSLPIQWCLKGHHGYLLS